MSAPWKCWPSVGGTSAGAINALIHALGFDLDSQHAILDSTDFRRFMDDQFGIIRDIRRLARYFGWRRCASPCPFPCFFAVVCHGLRLDSAEAIGTYPDQPEHLPVRQGRQVRRFTHCARALVASLLLVQDNQHLHSDDWQRTLYINTLDAGSTEFDLSAERYLRWWLGEEGAQPLNRLDQADLGLK